MSRIHLLGTIHCDIHGSKRLENALQTEKPDIITIETSPEWIDYLEANSDALIEEGMSILRKNGLNKSISCSIVWIARINLIIL